MIRRRTQLFISALGAFLTLFFVCGDTRAQDGVVKRIRIETSEAIRVEVRAKKKAYKVGETVDLELRSNQPCYVYGFSVVDGASKGVWLYPSRSGALHLIPSEAWTLIAGAGFKARRQGIHKISLLATTAALEVDRKRFKTGAALDVGKKSDLVEAMNKLKAMSGPSSGHQSQIIQIDVAVMSRRSGGTRLKQDPIMVVIKTDKKRYRRGDRVRVAFGAEADGAITLMVRYPRGREDFIEHYSIKAGQLYFQELVAARPFGRQSIVARFSPQSLPSEGVSKGLKPPKLFGEASYRFEVRR